MVFTNIFDFWNIFRNEIFGNTLLFVVVSIIAILVISTRKNVFSITNLLLISLWLVVIYIKTQLFIIWVFLVLGYAFIAYQNLHKSITR